MLDDLKKTNPGYSGGRFTLGLAELRGISIEMNKRNL
jgi:D-mannonate dehydratase